MAVFRISFEGNRMYRKVSVGLTGLDINRLYSSVSFRLTETEHVYMPGLFIARCLSLDQDFVAALKESSALLVKIKWPA